MGDSLGWTLDTNELDATLLFKQEADQLTTVVDLADALSRFGFSPDDKITRRELVTIYNQIKQAMEPEIFRLANSTSYADAKEMRSRLTNLRAEFDHLQLSGYGNVRNEQQSLFAKASKEVLRNTASVHSSELREQSETFSHLAEKHTLFHDIETNNLEQRISLIHTPNVRYSKRLIELFKSEYNLNKLKQYDEAIKVRRMIDKLLPIEEKNFHKKFNDGIEAMRTKLKAHQADEDQRFDEKLKGIEWTNLRRREKEMSVSQQRVANHAKDMSHNHAMETKLHAEMTVKPSALWQRRPGFEFTSAALRGQQLLDNARGKKTDKRVFAESLVSRHDYDNIPDGTVLRSPGRTGTSFAAPDSPYSP